jgi:hypothetical protein
VRQGVKPTIADVLAARTREPSPGRVFTDVFAAEGFSACAEYQVTITDSLVSSRRKPRYPARNMFKITDLSRELRRCYWYETPRLPEDPEIPGGELRRELTHRFGTAPVPDLLPTAAWVQVPDGLWQDPEAFASFIDYRLVMRLSAAENHAIIRGEGGLLNIPGIGRMTSAGPFTSTLLAACNEVEQMGGTADGLIINPHDYYVFLGEGHLMADLGQNGVFVVRTRLVDQGTAIVGDFGHGAQLFDAGRSMIRFAEPPPGTFAEPGVALTAEIRERVAVSLPANFFVVSL